MSPEQRLSHVVIESSRQRRAISGVDQACVLPEVRPLASHPAPLTSVLSFSAVLSRHVLVPQLWGSALRGHRLVRLVHVSLRRDVTGHSRGNAGRSTIRQLTARCSGRAPARVRGKGCFSWARAAERGR